MVIKKVPASEIWEPFSFGVSTPHVQRIKSLLLSGHSVLIELVYAEQSVGFLVVIYNHDTWSLEEIMETSFLDGGLGMHELHSLSVLSHGTTNDVTKVIDETLSSGFIVCLITDTLKDGCIVGSYLLRASASDTS